MGILFSKKVQKSSKHVLEDLEKQIKSKTRSRQRNQQYEKSFVSYLLLLSFGVYLVGVAVLYLYFRPSNWWEWLGYLAPLVLFPAVVYMVKKLLNLYFLNRKTQFDHELATLHEEKRRVLNEVMEKESYKTAVELLERYEPTHPSLQHKNTPAQQPQDRERGGRRSEVRRRVVPQNPHPSLMHMTTPQPSTMSRTDSAPATPATPVGPPQQHRQPHTQPRAPLTTPARPVLAEQAASISTNTAQPFIPPGMCLGAPPGPPTPCPILPRDRSKVDKVVEYLVGDGPNNRYALICCECHSHNGMALRDEFEYISFRCAYCFHLNPARRKKSSPKQSLEDIATASQDDSSLPVSENGAQRRQNRKRKSHKDEEIKEEANENDL